MKEQHKLNCQNRYFTFYYGLIFCILNICQHLEIPSTHICAIAIYLSFYMWPEFRLNTFFFFLIKWKMLRFFYALWQIIVVNYISYKPQCIQF